MGSSIDDVDDNGGNSSSSVFSLHTTSSSIGASSQHHNHHHHDALPHVIGRHGSQHPRPYTHHPNHSQQRDNPIITSIQSTFTNIKQHLQSNDILPSDTNQSIATFLSGTMAFYTTALSSQYIQYKILKISTGTRPTIVPITVGFMTVALGSWMGHLAGIGTTAAWSTIQDSWDRNRMNGLVQKLPEISNRALKSVDEMTRPMKKVFVNDLSRGERRERKEAWMHAARM